MHEIICGDSSKILPTIEANAFDLTLCSPPYEDRRRYGLHREPLVGDAWVQWSANIFVECIRVTKGLVAWVVEGKTKDFAYSGTPFLLFAELHRRGITMRKPLAYRRSGIPGSSGPDWLRNDYEIVICGTKGGRLPWSDNTAAGSACKYAKGGNPTNRLQDGRRINRRTPDGPREDRSEYKAPAIANPGHVIAESYTAKEVERMLALAGDVIECGAAGGGNLGSPIASENEAPFSERLAGPIVLSFCPPGGRILDPFGGSGTTHKVAAANGRFATSIELRRGQCEWARRRLLNECGLDVPILEGLS